MELMPLMTGKLNKVNDKIYTLMGHMGDIEKISFQEYCILKDMDGFKTIEEIGIKHNVSEEIVKRIFFKYKGKKRVTNLSQWNKISWCPKCGVHFSGSRCNICNYTGNKVVFSPPCDPFIAFEKERNFILDNLREKYSISLPKNSLFLVNNGVRNNIFFWEIEYAGNIILKIDFQGRSPDTWKFELYNKDIIKPNDNCILTKEIIKLSIEASRGKISEMTDKSKAIIGETSSFYKTKPLLYFSAGKESMVMLHLLKSTNIEANIITVVTGVEFPEDIIFIKEMKRIIESDNQFCFYFYEDNGENIINTLNKKGKLSAKDPWCRVDFKRKLKSKGTEEIYLGQDFVAYEGSRWYENDFRRRHPVVNFISDYDHQVWVHPLAEWNSYELWLYIFQNKLKINPMYFKGFQRTTCWLCPIVNPLHLYYSKEQYSYLWKKLEKCDLDAFEDDNSNNLPF